MKNIPITRIASLRKTILCLTFSLVIFNLSGQSVSIKEELLPIKTYAFGDPNPVPIISQNPKIAPYHKFESYEHKAKNKNWKVVTLENDYIKVLVLPEIGGKVWGAIEKSTGEEFLYKNEVIKFRNIAMRGPWTSGGIEFNFGIIGHHPSTATPVDYLTRTNADGSLSCIVSNIDLPSNTKWTVEIRLEKDKAYFETNASWYNASPLTESYYNWMTAAAVATNDLEFFIPGNAYVEHNGDAHPWPIDDQGRNLAMYKNNNFGPAKSYHIVGEYNDFFGGYYHDRNFGFGQWSLYEEMPGQKLWLWALSRSGGIWEDLLTDSDGQYIEFQAGRLFDQYFPGAINPISQVGFDPYMMDRWSEIWYPIKEIGGMEDAAEHGVLNVEIENGELTIGINALQKINADMKITINGELYIERLMMQPMEVFTKILAAKATDSIEITVDGTELDYSNNPKDKLIKRPFYPDKKIEVSQSEQLLFDGIEALEYREYELAREKLSKLIQLDPFHQAGLIKLAELEFRRTNYDIALELANKVLRIDTYNSNANYIAGIAYRAKSDLINALESLGWAARDIKYRSVAFAQMAEIYLKDGNYKRAKMYASKSLDFNQYNLNAREARLVSYLKLKEKDNFDAELHEILEMDPMNHFAKYIAENNLDTLLIQNEFKEETILGLTLKNYELGLYEQAESLLSKAIENPKNKIWKAYILHQTKPDESIRELNELAKGDIDFVFPFRRETIPVLEWATSKNSDWKFKYYLAQNYIAVGLNNKGFKILQDLSNTPTSDIFYRFRASMNDDIDFDSNSKDYRKALALNPNNWKVWEENIQFYLKHKKYNQAYDLSKKAYKIFKSNYNIGLAHAKSLVNTNRFNEVLSVLKIIQVLPFEHASESRQIYTRAHMGVALNFMQKRSFEKAITILTKSKEWPENIGVGKPYQPDERMQDYMLAIAYSNIGNTQKSKALLKSVVSFTREHANMNSLNHLYGLLAADDKDLLQTIISNATDKEKSKLALQLYKKNKDLNSTPNSNQIIAEDILDIARWAVQNNE